MVVVVVGMVAAVENLLIDFQDLINIAMERMLQDRGPRRRAQPLPHGVVQQDPHRAGQFRIIARIIDQEHVLPVAEDLAGPVVTAGDQGQAAGRRLQHDEAARIVIGRMDVAVGGGVVGQRIIDPAHKAHLSAQAESGNVALPGIEVLAADDHQPRFLGAPGTPGHGPQPLHRAEERGHAFEAKIVGHDQGRHGVGRQAQALPRRLAMRPAVLGRKPLAIDAVVDDANPLRGNAVIPLEIGRRCPRQGQHDLPVVRVLPFHEELKGAVPRQHPVGHPLQPSQPCRQKEQLAFGAGGHRSAVRMEDVAVPARAHVMDDVEGQRHEHGPHCSGEGDRRRVALERVVGDRQAAGSGRAAPGHDVYLVAQFQQPLRERPGPLFAAAAGRIELFQDQPDSHDLCLARRRICESFARNVAHQPLVLRPQFAYAQIRFQKQDLLRGPTQSSGDMLANWARSLTIHRRRNQRRRWTRCRSIRRTFEPALRRFLDQEVAAVEVAMIEAGGMEPPGDLGHLHDQAMERGATGGESPLNEILQLAITFELLAEEERFQAAVGVQLLAIGHQRHDVDAERLQGQGVFGLDTARAGRR